MSWHPDMPDDYKNAVVTGDARALVDRIPDESIDLIFTDPPYAREYLWCYRWLSEVAKRILKPSGFVLAMAGAAHLAQVYRLLGECLTYFWEFQIFLTGSRTGIVWPGGNNQIPIITRNKPLLAFRRVGSQALPRTAVLATFTGTGADKRYHVWGQDEGSTRYYVDCFSAVGDVVLDPFCGGGTTAAMCEILERRWVAFEVDGETAEVARQRVANTPVPLFVPELEQMELEGA